jgi:hypothetical protein
MGKQISDQFSVVIKFETELLINSTFYGTPESKNCGDFFVTLSTYIIAFWNMCILPYVYTNKGVASQKAVIL